MNEESCPSIGVRLASFGDAPDNEISISLFIPSKSVASERSSVCVIEPPDMTKFNLFLSITTSLILNSNAEESNGMRFCSTAGIPCKSVFF